MKTNLKGPTFLNTTPLLQSLTDKISKRVALTIIHFVYMLISIWEYKTTKKEIAEKNDIDMRFFFFVQEDLNPFQISSKPKEKPDNFLPL